MIVPALSASEYDVIVVGARPAGAGTALVLARRGLRVLMVDRGRYGTDTLSTHALMRAGVLQLARWGVLPAIAAAGTPPVRAASFIYRDEAVRVAIKPRDGVDALYAPRRTVLDASIVDVASAAGVTVVYGTAVIDLERTASGRVCGIVVRQDGAAPVRVRAGVVVGADGMRSTIARLVGAEVTRTGRWATGNVYGYWSGLPVDGYRWYFGEGLAAGAIPTNAGLTCVFAGGPSRRFTAMFRPAPRAGYMQVLGRVAADLFDTADAAFVGSLRAFPGVPGFLRRASGAGWVLVGDAAYFKDPLTAHGITEALIDAEYAARAIAAGTDAALKAYAVDRDRRVAAMFDVTDRIASCEWTQDEVKAMHRQLADAMSAEVTALNELTREAVPA